MILGGSITNGPGYLSMKGVILIPPMTHELSRYWDQPPRDSILIDDTHALMTSATLSKLGEYSHSTPSGVYPGKRWKSHRCGKWYLRWYAADGDPRGLLTPTREIILIY